MIQDRPSAPVRFTIRQIESFVSVAELLSFRAAAERLGLTAQAVSQLVAELEAILEFRLFDRTTRQVNLSGAGRDFLPSALAFMNQAYAATRMADGVRRREAGIVSVAAPIILASMALPLAIKEYAAKHPRVVVWIRDVAVHMLADSVAVGEVDLAIGPDRDPIEGLAAQTLFECPWVLWCAPDHALASMKEISWADLRHHSLVAAGCDYEFVLAQIGPALADNSWMAPVNLVDNISTALGIASQGLAATMAPAYVGVLAERFGLVMRRITEKEVTRRVCLYQSRTRALSPTAQGFAEYLCDWMPSWWGSLPTRH